MKKILPLLVVLFSAVQFASAQEIKFTSQEVNYGKIPKGANGVREIKFTNVGTAPLLIMDAKSSCACAVPQFSREPIMPGASGSISVKYDTKRVGQFIKYIIVTTNSISNNSYHLTISGEVAEEVPITPAGDKLSR